MTEFHPVLCEKNVRDLITLCESFSTDIRTCVLLLKLFAIAKHKKIALLQLPPFTLPKANKNKGTKRSWTDERTCQLYKIFHSSQIYRCISNNCIIR